uniref:(northern house mosquito) hypothetical protein n=1 Tax=Culex pipiens TaxID=7175 RepID=A0A8D8B8J7_CULPI
MTDDSSIFFITLLLIASPLIGNPELKIAKIRFVLWRKVRHEPTPRPCCIRMLSAASMSSRTGSRSPSSSFGSSLVSFTFPTVTRCRCQTRDPRRKCSPHCGGSPLCRRSIEF